MAKWTEGVVGACVAIVRFRNKEEHYISFASKEAATEWATSRYDLDSWRLEPLATADEIGERERIPRFVRGDRVSARVMLVYGAAEKKGVFLTEFVDAYKEHMAVMQIDMTGEIVTVGIDRLEKLGS